MAAAGAGLGHYQRHPAASISLLRFMERLLPTSLSLFTGKHRTPPHAERVEERCLRAGPPRGDKQRGDTSNGTSPRGSSTEAGRSFGRTAPTTPGRSFGNDRRPSTYSRRTDGGFPCPRASSRFCGARHRGRGCCPGYDTSAGSCLAAASRVLGESLTAQELRLPHLDRRATPCHLPHQGRRAPPLQCGRPDSPGFSVPYNN